MGIEAQFGEGKITASVADFQKKLEAAILYILHALGEDLVKYARDTHTYTDQTGNLTNSMGYVVLHRGVPAREGGFRGGEGQKAGLEAALKMASKVTKDDFVLIIVAGMNYAAAVEAKGYSVLLPSEWKAKKDFKPTMDTMFAKTEAAIRRAYHA